MGPIENILREAKKIVTNPDTFVRRYFAVNAENISVRPNGSDARRWCSIGACYKVASHHFMSDKDEGDKAKDYLVAASKIISPNKDHHPVIINDHYEHLIPVMFDKAIELAAKDNT